MKKQSKKKLKSEELEELNSDHLVEKSENKSTTEKAKKAKNVENILSNIQDKFGSEIVYLIRGKRKNMIIEGLSWGLPSVNFICMGNPTIGIPFGITEIVGMPSTGKTSLLLHAIAESQRQGKVCAFIDAEHAIDLKYAESLGVDLENLIFIQPDYGEQALELCKDLINEGVHLIGVDSTAALVPLAEIEGTLEKVQPGSLARMMTQSAKQLAGLAKKRESCIIFLNHIKMKIGVSFGNPETFPGGNAIPFYARLRLRTDLSHAKSKAISGAMSSLLGKEEKIRMGSLGSIKTFKNKVYMPFLDTEIPLYYGKGFDTVYDTYQLAAKLNLIEESKGGYKVNGALVKTENLESQLKIVIGFLEKWKPEK